jgi:hypothetical protein
LELSNAIPYLCNRRSALSHGTHSKRHIMTQALKAAKLQALQSLVFTFGENATTTKQFEELSADDQMLVEQMLDEA